jgi:hypothetical protein
MPGGMPGIFAVLLIIAPAAWGQQKQSLDGYPRLPPRPREICFLCNEPVAASDPVYQVDGQRLAVHQGKCDDVLAGDTTRWVARLKARGAFLSAPADRSTLSAAWLAAGVYILAGLVFAALCAQRALHTGRSPAAWFFAGLSLNAFGYVCLLTRPQRTPASPVPSGLRKVSATREPQPCPHCGSTNHPAATQCLACRGRLEPAVASEANRC